MKPTPAKSFAADKSLAALSHALRHPETWPPDFGEWNFLRYQRCAAGLACRLGMATAPTLNGMMEAFGISKGDAMKIFGARGIYVVIGPADVAGRIDAHLTRRA